MKLFPTHGVKCTALVVKVIYQFRRASYERLRKVDDKLGQAWTVRASKALALRQRVGGLIDRGLRL